MALNQQRDRDQDDDEPQIPRFTAGPQGHYAEESEQQDDSTQQELHRELEMLRQTAIAVPPAFHAQLNELHAQGQRIISLLTLVARRVDDAEARSRVSSLLEAVGESLLVSLNFSELYFLSRMSFEVSYSLASLGRKLLMLYCLYFQTLCFWVILIQISGV